MGSNGSVTLELHLTSYCILLWKMDIIPTSQGFLWIIYNNVFEHRVTAGDISPIHKSQTVIPMSEPEILGKAAGPLPLFSC